MSRTAPVLLRSHAAAHRDFLLHAGTFLLGRSLANDLVLEDLTVSRSHARVEVGEGACRVVDLGSQNGTFIDGIRVSDAVARPGQFLRFGDLAFRFETQGDSDAKSDKVSTVERCGQRVGDSYRVDLSGITEAQTRVFRLAVKGMSEKEMGKRLAISIHTVHNHLRAIYQALGVHSRSELLALVIEDQGALSSEGR